MKASSFCSCKMKVQCYEAEIKFLKKQVKDRSTWSCVVWCNEGLGEEVLGQEVVLDSKVQFSDTASYLSLLQNVTGKNL